MQKSPLRSTPSSSSASTISNKSIAANKMSDSPRSRRGCARGHLVSCRSRNSAHSRGVSLVPAMKILVWRCGPLARNWLVPARESGCLTNRTTGARCCSSSMRRRSTARACKTTSIVSSLVEGITSGQFLLTQAAATLALSTKKGLCAPMATLGRVGPTSSDDSNSDTGSSDAQPDSRRRFACTVGGCKKRYKRMSHLVRHLQAHAKERKHPCPVPACPKVFTRFDNVRNHVLKMHPGSVDSTPKLAAPRGALRPQLGCLTQRAPPAPPVPGPHASPADGLAVLLAAAECMTNNTHLVS